MKLDRGEKKKKKSKLNNWWSGETCFSGESYDIVIPSLVFEFCQRLTS